MRRAVVVVGLVVAAAASVVTASASATPAIGFLPPCATCVVDRHPLQT